MAPKTLMISDAAYVAEFIRQAELTGLMRQRLVIPPDYMGLLMRNGEVIDAFKGANFSLGGFFSRVAKFFGSESQFGVLLADLKPFRMQLGFTALTRDKVEAAGVATLELQVDPDRCANVLGMMQVRQPLTKASVLERLRPHLVERVFAAVSARVDAAELRGNVGLQDLLQGEAMAEIERVAGSLGIVLRSATIEWATTAAERDEMKRAEIERQQAAMDFALETAKREMERAAETTTVRLKTEADLARLQAASEDELARMALDNELAFIDARETGQRAAEMKALAHEVELMRSERVAKFEEELAGAGHAVDVAAKRNELKRLELEIQALERRQQVELRRLEQMTDLDVAERGHEIGARNVERLQDVELKAERARVDNRVFEGDAEARRELEKLRLQAEERQAMMQAGQQMTPEQILAVNAGLSPEVANVLVEQAHAKAREAEGASSMALMREMVQQATEARISSDAQARHFFGQAIEGAVGAAQAGAGAGRSTGAPSAASGETAEPETIECPKCGRVQSAKARFCMGCGYQLQT